MNQKIILKKVRVNNLKAIDLTLDPGQFIVLTGVSGSGKSSLAFETLYVEGQRRYIESLSTYARRFLGELPKPDADLISGVSPTIAIEQKTAGKNPRSTVGTMTGIYDVLRVLFARVGVAHCPVSGERVTPQSQEQILSEIQQLPEKTKLIILAPYAKGKKGEFKEEFADLIKKGFTRIRLDGQFVDLTEEISLDRHVAHDIDLVIDRLSLEKTEKIRLAEAVIQALDAGKGLFSVLNADTKEETLFSQYAYSPKSGLSYGPLEPQDFSFNHPSGMCQRCQGLGIVQEFILSKIIDPELSIAEDCCSIASSYQTVRYGNIYNNLASIYKFSVNIPWKKLPEAAKKVFLYGTEKKWTQMHFVHPHKRQSWMEYVQWRGVLAEARKKYLEATSDVYRKKMQELMDESVCPECHGARIRPYPAATQFFGKTIYQLTQLPIQKLLLFFDSIQLNQEQQIIAEELIKEIQERLRFLNQVGLHYLAIERTSPTLSGGESQRVRLASQIGSGLCQVTYILDEPSIGLHPKDNSQLLASLKLLRDKGNTVIVVEHDEETICAADYIVDVGPLAGQKGGEIVCHGTLETLLSCKESLTGAYLSGRLSIAIPKKRRKPSDQWIRIEQASHHNLKKIDVDIPLGLFIAVTGVSGSGKSSLISDILYPALSNELMGSQLHVGNHKAIQGMKWIDKVIAIDQSPIGRTPRSNPATYIKVWDEIRDLFASLPESAAQGYTAGRFSFNVKEGSCPHCSGMGMIKMDMDFMEDEWTACTFCEGKRFDQKTLSVSYRQKNIHDVLELTVAEACDFFANIPKIREKLEFLLKVGLDYLKLGQSSPTLSGGEAQRIKLAKELSRPSTGKTFYILDEPTTGLHFHDIHKLIDVLQALVEKNNSVLVIEHNMDLVKTCDYVIDLGPEAGEFGGEIIGKGTPEAIAKLKTPTAKALLPLLKKESLIASTATHKKAELQQWIVIQKAQQNNLKSINVKIPHGKITVCTGPSGSGKSSLAFETVFAEGQRRYAESLSHYHRGLIKLMPKPKVEQASNLMASIAIEQKSHAGNPRSLVGTMTEAYDYLRVLFAHLGTAYSPETGEPIRTISKDYVCQELLALPAKTRLVILAPLTLKSHESFEDLKKRLSKEGFLRIRLNQKDYELDDEIPFDKRQKNELFLVIDRLLVSDQIKKRLLDAIDTATKFSGGTLMASFEDKTRFFNLAFADMSTGKSYPPITPHTFSFNTQEGMCMECLGLGVQYGANIKQHPHLMRLTVEKLIHLLWKDYETELANTLLFQFLEAEDIPLDMRLQDLPDDSLQRLLQGSKTGEWLEKKEYKFRWVGFNRLLSKLVKSEDDELKEDIYPLLEPYRCIVCQGTRLNPLARNVRIGKSSISDVCALPIEQAKEFAANLSLEKKNKAFLQDALDELNKRLHFLDAIGLGYLSLDRSAPTLSGGETQRIRLARQLGSGLTGCLYVLDEPTIGLHPHNNALLNQSLRNLCALGNTLLLVEHDPLTVEIADYILEFGPKAGNQGGYLVAEGTLESIKKNPDSLTGAYLTGRKKIPLPEKRRSSSTFLTIKNAQLHNLKNIDVQFPIKTFCCLTGVSGSGKSTLMNDLLKPALMQSLSKRTIPETLTFQGATFTGLNAFDKLIAIDQNPIGHTIRADVSTYVDLSSPLRHFFAELPDAAARGLLPKNFSSNHLKGMCMGCFGLGMKTIHLQFLPSVRVLCDSCHGYRLNPLSLQVKYKGKHLGQLLKMNAHDARGFLPPIPKVLKILDTLEAVGLDYLELGQEIATLSGGEAQRLRLTKELAKRPTGKTLYLFDEPTIGLHADDTVKLLQIFHALVDKGNSVIIIEHNLDVIANADHIIDLGPGAGPHGGLVVATGTPEEVAKVSKSYTAQYLAKHLKFLKRS